MSLPCEPTTTWNAVPCTVASAVGVMTSYFAVAGSGWSMTCQVFPSVCRMTTLTFWWSLVFSETIVSSVLGSNTTIERSKKDSAA
jgi:hypothetical protein